MATIKHKGEEIQTLGDLPSVGVSAPDFSLIDASMNTLCLQTFQGKKLVLNIVPSIDTSTCLLSAKYFAAAPVSGVAYITISRDTPFAFTRVCQHEQIAHLIRGSDMSHEFGNTYQCEIVTGRLAHFLSRAIVVLDEQHIIRYTEQVADISQEPNYSAVLECLKNI